MLTSAHILSSLFLNALTDGASTISCGKSFQCVTGRWLKKATGSNHPPCRTIGGFKLQDPGLSFLGEVEHRKWDSFGETAVPPRQGIFDILMSKLHIFMDFQVLSFVFLYVKKSTEYVTYTLLLLVTCFYINAARN